MNQMIELLSHILKQFREKRKKKFYKDIIYKKGENSFVPHIIIYVYSLKNFNYM